MQANTDDADPLFQYVVLRRDLQEYERWPLGALIAQEAMRSDWVSES